MSKREHPSVRPPTVHVALKILCRQCSEFACANIMSSASVGSRPSAPKRSHSHRTSSLLSASPNRRSASRRARSGSRRKEIRTSGLARVSRKMSAGTASPPAAFRRGGSGAGSAIGRRRSVMRSYSGSSAGPATPSGPNTSQSVPRSTLRTGANPQFPAMSVALLDHGEMVPSRGMTRTRRALAGSGGAWSPECGIVRTDGSSNRPRAVSSSSSSGTAASTKYADHAERSVIAGCSRRSVASIFSSRNSGSAAGPGR